MQNYIVSQKRLNFGLL